ncbi:Pimeloyl-ACP methyl ester carboxylesterase [Mesorhizobium sp. NFR06]|uniref:alpha/beta fold hydrolase n=1 Tax=Mesorhizobium sp. NFR06 TaxID=1566290 RepID=UPI0008E28E15|nr:alpha/beta hydrolase [Mesorhizobium sp. NFR06]SFP72813.1 Pimeloyl-ACP methyl ester carboxylesterase [Mesorhizobium sp. NFR06]
MQQPTQTLQNGKTSAAGRTLSSNAATVGKLMSSDGTPIAYERRGTGYPLILVDGALCSRAMGPSRSLAQALAPHFAVFSYDRRGRGESGDSPPYATEREVDDIAALLDIAGGEAFVWGTSSGAVLALLAAACLPGIKRLALYEAPLIVDDSRPTTEADWEGIRTAIATGRRGNAVRIFLKSVGMPRPLVFLMRLTPIWSKLKAVAHTLPYDGAIVADDQLGRPLVPGRWGAVEAPVLVTDGGGSPAWMRHGNQALADALPNALYLTLAGQNHMLKAAVHAPVLVDFFNRPGSDVGSGGASFTAPR